MALERGPRTTSDYVCGVWCAVPARPRGCAAKGVEDVAANRPQPGPEPVRQRAAPAPRSEASTIDRRPNPRRPRSSLRPRPPRLAWTGRAGATLQLLIGVLVLAMGAVWMLQGTGVLGGSTMSDQSLWVIIGAIAATAGAALACRGLTARRGPP